MAETDEKPVHRGGQPPHDPQTRARVVEAYRRLGRVDLACADVGVDRGCHYDWLKQDSEYKALFTEAKEQVMGLLRDECWRRAYHGTMKPTSIGGKLVIVHEFSDDLLKFLMKTGDPQQYGDSSKLAVSGPDGKPLLDLASVTAYCRAKNTPEEPKP